MDFRHLFKGYIVFEIQVLRSDNAKELNSAKVKPICLYHGINYIVPVQVNNIKRDSWETYWWCMDNAKTLTVGSKWRIESQLHMITETKFYDCIFFRSAVITHCSKTKTKIEIWSLMRELKRQCTLEMDFMLSSLKRNSLLTESKIHFLDSPLQIKSIMICSSRKAQICL